MVPPNNFGPDLSGKAVNETPYRGMIGSLMYLTASRPEIKFSTCLCARYQANPKESHLIAIKRIFRKSISVEAEYVAAAGCCANILWMKSQLTYYDIIYEKRSYSKKGQMSSISSHKKSTVDISTKPSNSHLYKR
ncbi:hypothetical protein Tco_0129271 [Tanacetum coccineum]